MKVAPLITVALILCVAFPGPIQAKKKPKPKPKFCVGKDGNKYAVGQGYDDNDGKACVRYKCVKKKKKSVMKKGKCVENGEWSSWSIWSACSNTCGSATRKRKRTCSSPAPSNGGKPCSGPEEEIEECSNPSCGPDMNVKVDSLELNVQSLNDSLQTLQTTMQSVLELMTTMQSSINKQGTCMSDFSSLDCPYSAPGKIGVVDGINSNKAGINNNTAGVMSNKDDINTNKAGITSSKADINTNKADVNANKAGINNNTAGVMSNKDDINTNKADVNANKAGINTNKASILAHHTDTTTTTPTTTTETSTPINNIVVSGGRDGNKLMATSEVVSPKGVCSEGIPPLPVAIYLHASVFFNNQLLVCGGWTNAYQKKCYQLKDAASKAWVEGPSLNIPRAYFTMTKVGEEVYAVGGEGSAGDLDTIEKLSGNPGEWKVIDKKMTTIRELHCTAYWKKMNSLVVIGGNYLTNKAQSFDLETGEWTDLAELPVLRELACSIYEDTIVVTGGWDRVSRQDNKKIYVYKEGNWSTLGEMDGTRRYHTMDVLHGNLLVIGGNGRDGIEQIHSNGTVETLNFSLSGVRAKHSAAKVPAQKFPCLN